MGTSVDESSVSQSSPPAAISSQPLRRAVQPSAARDRRYPWDNATLRLKAHALVVTAVMAGVLLGTLEARLGFLVWPLMVGLSVLLLAGCALVNHWIGGPVDRLVSRLERLARTGEPVSLRRLPVKRDDELGQIARAVHQLGESLVRQQSEASTLRKTLESRAAEATRRATRQLERLAMRDPLTDLGNRRCLDEHLDALVATARDESRGELLCVLLDIDNFKPLNDTLGHAAGDEVLAFLGSLIRGCARDGDLAIRLGGDEFVVLLPTDDLARATQFINMVRSLFRQQTHTMFPDGPVADLSIGVAGLKRDGCPDGEALLARADGHLYRAKRAGKGQTCGAEES